MDMRKAFPSRFIKAIDLEGDVALTIKNVTEEDIGTDKKEQKPVLWFRELEQGLVLNKINTDVIMDLHGHQSDDWIGKRIAVFADETDFAGKRVPCIRVRMRIPSGGNQVSQNGSFMKTAWEAFQGTQSGESKEEIAINWKKATQAYFGTKPKEAIKPEEWKRFIDDDFAAVPASGDYGDERQIADDDIPF